MRVNRINGTILIDNAPAPRGPKSKKIPPETVRFSGLLVSGKTPEEIIKNFEYSTLFTNKEKRKEVRKIEREGKIKLQFFSVEGVCGLEGLAPGACVLN